MSGRNLVGGADDWSGGVVSDLAECVLAPNPSPWTLDGTNTWILGSRGGRCVIVDPGPLTGGHREAILESVERRQSTVGAVVLTHGHLDHSEGARELANYLGVGVRAWDPALSVSGHVDDATLAHDDRVAVEGADIRVIATPGHSSDSVCFLIEDSVLTGDTVLGRGTSMVAHPDGTLAEYLASLQILARVCSEHGVQRLLPGHGPVLEDPTRVVEYYVSHRHERLRQVSSAMKGGAVTAREIVDLVYADVPAEVRPAAEATVLAQLEYLRDNPLG